MKLDDAPPPWKSITMGRLKNLLSVLCLSEKKCETRWRTDREAASWLRGGWEEDLDVAPARPHAADGLVEQPLRCAVVVVRVGLNVNRHGT